MAVELQNILAKFRFKCLDSNDNCLFSVRREGINMRALLVDDSKTARTLLKQIFNELGSWEIVEAENGQDALDKLVDVSSLDLVCIDWNMPVMNGLEF